MQPPDRPHRPFRAWPRTAALLAGGLLAAACASRGGPEPTRDYLDEDTAATITRVTTPCVLASDDPARAAKARDYLYVASLGVNQGGQRRWWLWLGLWSTIDRGVTGGAGLSLAKLSRVILLADGEPMELDAAARVNRVPGLGQPPYATPVATAESTFLPLTGSQVDRLARAGTLAARTEMDGEILLWQPWAKDQACVSRAAGSP